jgi:site-specific recombinase XerD
MWASKAGIAKKVTPHVLRHTFASNLYAKTKNLLAVQKALGHEYITTTQIYTHIQDEELHSALETL